MKKKRKKSRAKKIVYLGRTEKEEHHTFNDFISIRVSHVNNKKLGLLGQILFFKKAYLENLLPMSFCLVEV